MSEILDVVQAITKPCEKLIDAVSSAIGKAYEPRHVRKMADAKAYEMAIVGQSLRDNMDIPINYNQGELSMNTEDFEEFVKRTERRMAFQEMMKQKNIEAVVDDAYALLEDEDDPASDEPVDKDWMIRFFNSVQDVSNEEMQRLWAKVLAGEVKRPKSFSMRTLEILRNMSSNEAKAFNEVCKNIIYNGKSYFVPGYKDYYEKCNISYETLIRLDEAGLINTRGDIIFYWKAKKHKKALCYNGNVAILASLKEGEETIIEIDMLPLSIAGQELFEIINEHASDEKVLILMDVLMHSFPKISFESMTLREMQEKIREKEKDNSQL